MRYLFLLLLTGCSGTWYAAELTNNDCIDYYLKRRNMCLNEEEKVVNYCYREIVANCEYEQREHWLWTKTHRPMRNE